MEESRVIEGRFELLDEIGRGGRGVVYRGWHRLLDRAVAIKVLHAQSAQDADALKEFRREARILADLKHPHIVEVHAVGAMPESAAPYVVMEFVSGKTLAAILETEHPLPLKRCVDLAVQIAQGLQYAHERGIVHRDLKPANIMVEQRADDGSEHIKIVDFGLAREEAIGTGATVTRIVGSPPYMSPEQCMGKRATSRSDLYSLGCVLYETLCGAPPFSADSGIETMQQHMNSTAPPVNALRPDVPNSLANVVANLLAKNPESRYATASDVETDLLRIGKFLAGVTSEPIIEVRTDKALPSQSGAAAGARKRAVNRLILMAVILVFTPIMIVVAKHLMTRDGEQSHVSAGPRDKPINQISFPKNLTAQQRYRILKDSPPREVRSYNAAEWDKVCAELEADPKTPTYILVDAHHLASEAFQAAQQWKPAVFHMRRRAEIYKSDYARRKDSRKCADAYLLLSKLLMTVQLPAEAAEAAKEGLKYLPHARSSSDQADTDDLHARLSFAELDALWTQGHPSGTIKEAQSVLKLQLRPVVRDAARAYFVRAFLHESKPREAIAEAQKALQVSADSEYKIWIERDMAQAYLNVQDYKSAERTFRRCLQDAPEDMQHIVTTDQARMGLAETLHALKKYDEELRLTEETVAYQTKQGGHAWGDLLVRLYDACRATGNMEPIRRYKKQYETWVSPGERHPLD